MIHAMGMSWDAIRNTYGHFHPALVHFPIGLVLTGAAVEMWSAVVRRRREPSQTARLLLGLGLLATLVAVGSGLALFRPDDFRGRTHEVALMHRTLGLASVPFVLVTVLQGARRRASGFGHVRLWAYRLTCWGAALLVGLAGHYGGWVVFGWGWVWTP
jgi:uncharacterized membrane protein